MDTKHTASQIILTAIVEAERSQMWVSRKTGIPLTTLRRKLDGHSDFLLSEVAKIAMALERHPAELLPEPFQSEAVA